jgi:hypothetical protein
MVLQASALSISLVAYSAFYFRAFHGQHAFVLGIVIAEIFFRSLKILDSPGVQ